MSIVAEFREFAIKGNAIELAVGIIIGAAFNRIVNSLVEDILMPPIALIMGRVDFTNIFIPLTRTDARTLSEAKAAGVPTINIGVFFNHTVSFLITAFAVFLLVKMMNRLRRQHEKNEPT